MYREVKSRVSRNFPPSYYQVQKFDFRIRITKKVPVPNFRVLNQWVHLVSLFFFSKYSPKSQIRGNNKTQSDGKQHSRTRNILQIGVKIKDR